MDNSIIIVGAGAAGLMAAAELSAVGYHVTILEAQSRAGGRIHTLDDGSFSCIAEAGAEFVHGPLPFTTSLLREAGIPLQTFDGEIWEHNSGDMEEDETFVEMDKAFKQTLEELDEDITVTAFFDKYFPGAEHAATKESLTRYIEGYEAADIHKASMLALKGDLLQPQEEQYRPATGYRPMVAHLLDKCLLNGCVIKYAAPVTEIHWQRGKAKVVTPGANYTAGKVLLTIPLGVLQLQAGDTGHIRFQPEITAKVQAAQHIGWGTVIKVLFEFSRPFWREDSIMGKLGKNTKGLGFIFSQQPIPTWWTQLPEKNSLLTGWLAGPAAGRLNGAADKEIETIALQSLATIFQLQEAEVRAMLTASKIVNWQAMPYIKGAYAYKMVNSEAAVNELRQPLEGTIFFAGEAIYTGPYAGTVEAALASAVNVVKDICSS